MGTTVVVRDKTYNKLLRIGNAKSAEGEAKSVELTSTVLHVKVSLKQSAPSQAISATLDCYIFLGIYKIYEVWRRGNNKRANTKK